MEYFMTWIFLAVTLVVSWYTGALVFSAGGHKGSKSLQDFFLRTLTGICLLVFFYALVKTGARSSLMLMIIPGIVLWWKNKEKHTGSILQGINPSLKWMLLSFLFAALIVFLLRNYFESITIQEDSANYLKISESLRLTGQENTRHFRNIYGGFHGMEPYHYFEMWLAGLFMEIPGGLTHMECLRTCSYGFILVLTLLGLLSVCERVSQKLNVWHFLTAILFLFYIPNIVQLVFNYDTRFNFGVEVNPLNRDNFRTYWLFLIPSLLYFQRKEFFTGSVLLLLLPAISFTTAPAVFGALALLIILNRWTKFMEKKEVIRLFAVMAVFAVLLLALLSVFKLKNVISLYAVDAAGIMGYFKASWKAVIYVLVMEVVNFLIVFLPSFLALALMLKSSGGLKKWISGNRFLLIFILLINVSGIVLFQLTSFMNNTYQFAFIGYCAAALVIFILFQEMSSRIEKNNTRRAAYVLFILVMIFSALRLTGLSRNSLFEGQSINGKQYVRYSGKYLAEIDSVIAEKGTQPGAYIADSAYYSDLYYSKRLPDFYFPGSSYYIFARANDSYQFCFSDTAAIYYNYKGTPRDFNFLKQSVTASLFHRDFMNEGISTGEKRRKAIEKFHIRYLILTPGVEPDEEWRDLITRQYKDNKTGEQFVVLH